MIIYSCFNHTQFHSSRCSELVQDKWIDFTKIQAFTRHTCFNHCNNMEASVKTAMSENEVLPAVIVTMSFPLESLYAGAACWVVPFDGRSKVRPFTGLTYKLLRKVVVKANAARTKGLGMVFGESRIQHYREKQPGHWKSDGNVVTELDEYKSLGTVKNYAVARQALTYL